MVQNTYQDEKTNHTCVMIRVAMMNKNYLFRHRRARNRAAFFILLLGVFRIEVGVRNDKLAEVLTRCVF